MEKTLEASISVTVTSTFTADDVKPLRLSSQLLNATSLLRGMVASDHCFKTQSRLGDRISHFEAPSVLSTVPPLLSLAEDQIA